MRNSAGRATNNPAMLWDLFCRVIDNFGDIGMAWRLAAQLGERGQQVRLWVDDASALAWMAPQGARGVQVLAWRRPLPTLTPGAVVIETFGCALPDAFVTSMARQSPPPVWINLEYLSAEPYVERSHGLLSPQHSGPGAGLKKWFFYPGFTPATGGLLQGPQPGCDPDPAAARQLARKWAQSQAWTPAPGERAITVFCYDNPALPALLRALGLALTQAGAPAPGSLKAVLWLPPGPARQQLAGAALPDGMRAVALPYLCQTDFDQLLAAADFNLVRGEDSFVRAQLASPQPFLWQAYPQSDGAQAAKLAAFLDLYLAGEAEQLASAVRAAFYAVNGLGSVPRVLPDWPLWCASHARWRRRLQAQVQARTDLCSQLLAFVQARRS